MEKKLSEKIYEDIRKDIVDGEYAARDFLSESMIASKYRRGYMVNIYSNDELNQIQMIRKSLEALCVKLAIKNATDQDIEALRFYEKADSSNMDPRETINARFHIGLAEISGNEFLPDTLRPLVNKASMTRIKSTPDTDNFNKIIDAMLKRDEEQALHWLDIDIHYLGE